MTNSNHNRLRPLRVAVYCRVSTEEQATEGYSIRTQTELAKEWCKRHLDGQDYEIEIFADEGFTGKLGWEPPKRGRRRYRLALARLVEAIEAGKVDVLIVYRLDRLARSMSVFSAFVDQYLSDDRVRFVSLTEEIDLTKSYGRLMANMLASFADFERDIIAQNIKSAHEQRKKEGLPIGTHYGWRPVPLAAPGARPTIEPEPKQAFWVPKVFEWFLRGWGMRRIAEELDRQGAPLYLGADRWSRGSVKTILTNPINAGYIDLTNKEDKQKGEESQLTPGQHYEQRIIEKDLFDTAQRELEGRRVEGKRPLHGNLQLLYKVAKCGLCGQPVQVTRHRVNKDAFSYRCRGSEEDHKETCRGWAKDTRLVDRAVLKQLSAFVDRPEFQELVAEEAREQVLNRQVERLNEEKQRLQEALHEKAEQERRLVNIHIKGDIEEELYSEKYAQIEHDKRQLNAELEAVEAQLGDEAKRLKLLEEVQTAIAELPQLWKEMDPEERRHLLKQVIEYCHITPIGDRKHQVRVKFHFLPEVVEKLSDSKSRMTSLFDDVEHIADRELAYLTLRSDEWSDKEIQEQWEVTAQAVYYLRRSVLRRLGVDTVEEAIRLARGRIDKERDRLPLGPTGWHTGRPKQNRLSSRQEEALVRYIEEGSVEQVAKKMGIAVHTVECYLWHARKELGCDSIEEAAEKYLEMKEGRLPNYGEPLPFE